MLGRTANGLFWMSRYLERAENTARLVDAGFRMSLIRQGGTEEDWGGVLESAGVREVYGEKSDGVSGAEAIDFLNEVYAKDVDFYQTILTDRGAVGSLLAARGGAAYGEADAFFGGEKVWQNFSDWLAKVPSVNYGIFTNEADTAVTAQLPALSQGTPVDEVLKAIDAEVSAQVQ